MNGIKIFCHLAFCHLAFGFIIINKAMESEQPRFTHEKISKKDFGNYKVIYFSWDHYLCDLTMKKETKEVTAKKTPITEEEEEINVNKNVPKKDFTGLWKELSKIYKIRRREQESYVSKAGNDVKDISGITPFYHEILTLLKENQCKIVHKEESKVVFFKNSDDLKVFEELYGRAMSLAGKKLSIAPLYNIESNAVWRHTNIWSLVTDNVQGLTIKEKHVDQISEEEYFQSVILSMQAGWQSALLKDHPAILRIPSQEEWLLFTKVSNLNTVDLVNCLSRKFNLQNQMLCGELMTENGHLEPKGFIWLRVRPESLEEVNTKFGFNLQ